MTPLPHDLADLAMAPVLIAVDTQLESFCGATQHEIAFRIALETDRQPRDAAQRAEAVLETLLRFVDMHGWEARWSTRGLRLSHGDHEVTLGVPSNLISYLAVA